MKAKFLKKEIILVILSLLFSNILVGCSINTPPTDSDNKKNSSISQNEKKEISKSGFKPLEGKTFVNNGIPGVIIKN
ncbi:hypothetical protein [Clostridium sp. ZS2-4]|uniref:hypothetical protein n=1 Tax=Clostridium sp. ZS2-4 TaxID=2987703 RepID=UPI00227A4414|nr:hypothetical protein [Clostridium sp. ZS2-4]MCY6354207.1 hypothetical protein [Clostridium sp. ZS2-4]